MCAMYTYNNRDQIYGNDLNDDKYIIYTTTTIYICIYILLDLIDDRFANEIMNYFLIYPNPNFDEGYQ